VAKTTSDADYVAASRASDDIIFLRQVLKEAGFQQINPTPLFNEISRCSLISEDPLKEERSKHIDYHIHALLERIHEGIICPTECTPELMLAEVLTKNLSEAVFTKH
jgi:hypothetical protein